MNIEQMQIYTPLSPVQSFRQRYFVRSLKKIKIIKKNKKKIKKTLPYVHKVSLELTVIYSFYVISSQIGNTQAVCVMGDTAHYHKV